MITLINICTKKILITILMIIFSQTVCALEKNKIAGTYSSLTYNEEGGDLLGYEFRIIPTKKGYKAVVQVSEGGIGNVYLVDVEQKDELIFFDVPVADDYIGKFKGKVSQNRLAGILVYPSGYEENISLKRSASYWER